MMSEKDFDKEFGVFFNMAYDCEMCEDKTDSYDAAVSEFAYELKRLYQDLDTLSCDVLPYAKKYLVDAYVYGRSNGVSVDLARDTMAQYNLPVDWVSDFEKEFETTGRISIRCDKTSNGDTYRFERVMK